MTKDSLFSAISSVGLHPILLKGEASDKPNDDHFDGSFDEFLREAKAIGSKAIFIRKSFLEEYQFSYDPEDVYDDENFEEDDEENSTNESEEEVTVDLSLISPSLAKYKHYLGMDYAFELCAKGGAADLHFEIREPWIDEFDEQFELAVSQLREKESANEKEIEKEQDKRSEKVREIMNGMIDDPAFISIPTLRNRTRYAVEIFPELETLALDQNHIYDEVRRISDQIKRQNARLKK